MATTPDEIMTMDELAEYLKISKSTLYKLAVGKKLPGQKVGKRWRFHKGAIDDWLRQHPEQVGNRSAADPRQGGAGK